MEHTEQSQSPSADSRCSIINEGCLLMIMRKILQYSIQEVEPYISWTYFYHAWQMSGKSENDREELRKDAEKTLRELREKYTTKAVFGLYEAYADGDDIIVEGIRLPMLRQQRRAQSGTPCLCMADFIMPANAQRKDTIGIFAATVEMRMETEHHADPYQRMMVQTLADRLAEATTEKMHQEVRTKYWGYASDEKLSINEILRGGFQGIRPAVGYPSMPDASINFLIQQIIDMSSIGILLTENGAMRPHASVSGLMIAHPKARYFDVGPVASDQLADYANRRGIPLELARRFLASNII